MIDYSAVSPWLTQSSVTVKIAGVGVTPTLILS